MDNLNRLLKEHQGTEVGEALKLLVAQKAALELDCAQSQQQLRGCQAALGLNVWPVTPDVAQSLVHVIVNKYRVSDHFCLTPEDVATLINHVRVVTK